MSFEGESETIEQILKMSWTFINDRYHDYHQFAAVIFTLYITFTFSHSHF